MTRFLIDPGHGGDQPGAVYNGIAEKDVNIAVGLRCSDVLRDLGHEVFLTRDRDTGIPLTERVRMMNQYKPHAFLSIHCNASPNGEKTHGAETYYRDEDDKLLAKCVQEALVTYAGMGDIGVFQDELRLKKRLAVLNNNKISCALVEMGYLSSPSDMAYLSENIRTLGEILAHGADWFTCIKGGVEKKNWPA